MPFELDRSKIFYKAKEEPITKLIKVSTKLRLVKYNTFERVLNVSLKFASIYQSINQCWCAKSIQRPLFHRKPLPKKPCIAGSIAEKLAIRTKA